MRSCYGVNVGAEEDEVHHDVKELNIIYSWNSRG